MKQHLARFAVWLAARCGVILVMRPRAELMASAHEFCAHVEPRTEPWEWKHRQAYRAMQNRFPRDKARDLNLAIELAVQEIRSGRP